MKKFLVFPMVLIVSLLCVGCVSDSEFNALKKDVEYLKNQIAITQNTIPTEDASKDNEANQESTEESTYELSDVPEYTLTAGQYEVGVDIAPGKYDLICKSGTGLVSVDAKNGNSILSEVMGGPDADPEIYIKEYKNAPLKNGSTIKITGSASVTFIKK